MASNVSTVDGMGFEEVNQESYTAMVSGTSGCFTVLDADSADLTNIATAGILATSVIAGNASIIGSISDSKGKLQSTAIANATALYGYRILAGSVLMGDSISGLIAFPSAGSFSSANYFLALTARDYGVPQWSRTGSQAIYCGSGARRASGCWIVGGSGAVVDWIAVGI